MTFSSVEFIIFFSVVFICYWLACRTKDLQNGLLVLASCVFYGWWDWRFLGLLGVTALSTYASGQLMRKYDADKGKRKAVLIATIVLNLGILFYFKYFNFFIESFVDFVGLFGVNLTTSTLKIMLPVGISFYTFSALSYVIDVYQRKIEATDDLLAYSAYVMFFPSILSGPISRAQKQLPQYMQKRCFDYDAAIAACKAILMGGVMKLCLADRLGIYVDAVYGNIAQHNGTSLLLASVLYTLQIYADFAGYSLMAIGFGRLLGIELPINFNRPYFSTTVTEFWRRWHISLTTWFRDYIYFPLGGNRCSKMRWMLNTMIVFVVSGLWHGAAYTFLIWGAMHGICMIIERLIYGDKIKHISNKFSLSNLLRLAVTFTIVNFAWIFFRIENLSDVVLVLQKIFTQPGVPFIDIDVMFMFVVAMIIVFAYDLIKECNWNIHLLSSRSIVVRYATAVLLICYIISYGVLNGGSFIYFQF